MTSAPGQAGDSAAAEAPTAGVEAVVVSFNTRGDLEHCLGELTAQGLRTIVVDSASTDSSVDLVRERFPRVELVALAVNKGFGAAANRGIARARGTYALLLNADARPLDGALGILVAAGAANPRAAVVAPRLLNLDGSPQRSVFGYPEGALSLAAWVAFPNAVTNVFRAWRGVQRLVPSRDRTGKLHGEVDPIAPRDFPAGAALLILKEAFDEVGGFDEAFFMYGEETDLCQRLRQLGWGVMLCPEAHFLHVGGAATVQSRQSMYRERLRSHLRFIAKHQGERRADRARRLLARALQTRSVIARGPSRRERRETARWLMSTKLETLLR